MLANKVTTRLAPTPPRTTRATLLFALVLGFGATGCFSNSVLTLARTAPKGTVTGYVGPSGVLLSAPGSNTGTAGWVQIEGGFHYSVTDNVEVGLRAYIPGIAFDTKIGFIRSPTGESGFNLSLDPEIGVMGFGVGGSSSGSSSSSTVGAAALTFNVPLLLGVDFYGHELVIAPRVTDWLLLAGSGGSTAGANILYVGGGIGVAFRITQGFRLMPNFSIMAPVAGTAFINNNSTSGTAQSAALVAQFGLGFLFGGANERAPAPMGMPTPMSAPMPTPEPVQ